MNLKSSTLTNSPSSLIKNSEVYCSWQPDRDAFCTDAFTVNWSNFKFFAFPPIALILRTLQKIRNDQAQGIVIVPYWSSQAWFPLWNSMLIGEPIVFQPDDNLLLSACRSVKHPLASKMRLMAGLLSGRVTKIKD